jgi:tRNA pseudouridine55 synthase
MARRRKGRDVHGVLLLDKPAGLSSNQALQSVRKMFRARKAGHTGSLDPFATGMLPICMGEASKTAGFMLDAAKTYQATAVLGHSTDTGDIEGDLVERCPIPALNPAEIDRAMNEFRGRIEQVPPMYSALKHEGQRLYKLARMGKTVQRPARVVTVHRLELLSWDSPSMVFEVHCSKGTYVRTLAEDLARAMGSCGHLTALRRLAVEPFGGQAMVTLDELAQAVESGREDEWLLPVDAGLSAWPRVEIDAARTQRFSHGNPVAVAGRAPGPVRVYTADGWLLGLGELGADGILRPRRVFVGMQAR